MQRIGAALGIVIVLAALRGLGPQGAAGQDGSPAPAAALPNEPPVAFQGVASCASTACHHGGGAQGAARSEYTTWATHDPHARAYAILFDAPARQIVKNLDGANAKSATDNLLCLNCHVQPGLKTLPANGDRGDRPKGLVLADGVGCESCHGAAAKWLTVHYQEAWKSKTPAQKAALGFRHTKDLVVRAQICVKCHVGGEDAEVNHRLIAAGHPRLRFEYAAYLANLPKHWDEKKDRQGRPDFDMRVWAAGQIVSMRAALKLLEHRATTPGQPWPELAEYDCFACHHVLTDARWRRDPKYLKQQPPGSFPWGTWYYPLAAVMAEHPPRAKLAFPDRGLKELRRLMQPPYSDANRQLVGKVARETADQLAGWLPGLRQPASDWDVRSLANALEDKARKDMGHANWDETAQLYLALAAQRPVGPRKELTITLWKSLEFPRKFESPRGFDPRRLDGKLKATPPSVP